MKLRFKICGVIYLLPLFLLNPAAMGATKGIDNETSGTETLHEYSFFLHLKDNAYTPISIEIPPKIGVEFKKEPFPDKGRIFRSVMRIGDGKNPIPFALNASKRTLYLDLNRNLDLTDDPQYSAKPYGMSNYQYFEFRIPLKINDTSTSYLINTMFYLQRNGFSGFATIHSRWEGLIELYGKKYKFIVADDMDGKIDLKGQDYLFVITENDPSGEDVIYNLMTNRTGPRPDILFLNGHAFRVSAEFARRDNKPCIKVTFRETQIETEEVRITGQYIKCLYLSGNNLIIQDSPGKEIRIPAGRYPQARAILGDEKSKPLATCDISLHNFEVVRGKPVTLTVGAPLKSIVVAGQNGRYLQLSYRLIDNNNNDYTLSAKEPKQPPRAVIYQGDREIQSGNFEYG
ncbi:MAG: hypothetical protein NT106_11800 [Candidatus Sumerlaeota bacterium]|nr:hypothetical protein [Candidatus Sumerlaeota bacterium]